MPFKPSSPSAAAAYTLFNIEINSSSNTIRFKNDSRTFIFGSKIFWTGWSPAVIEFLDTAPKVTPALSVNTLTDPDILPPRRQTSLGTIKTPMTPDGPIELNVHLITQEEVVRQKLLVLPHVIPSKIERLNTIFDTFKFQEHWISAEHAIAYMAIFNDLADWAAKNQNDNVAYQYVRTQLKSHIVNMTRESLIQEFGPNSVLLAQFDLYEKNTQGL